MRSFDKRSCLNRAKELLAQNDDDDALIYAALELRQCMEAIIYEKLKVYSKYVPGVVFEKWQPQHALKTLVEFEPDADENLRMKFTMESKSGKPRGPWTDLGEHRTLKLSWLKKNYNKLGSYLHVPHGTHGQLDINKIQEDLEKIASELETVVGSSIVGASLAVRVQFKCAVCGQDSLANVDVIRKTGRVVCITPDCGAIHSVKEEQKGWKIQLEATDFKCRNCGSPITLENRFLDVGFMFKCPKCKTEHIIVTRHWGYATKEEAKKHTGYQATATD